MLSRLLKRFEFDLVRVDLLLVTLMLFIIGGITFFSASLGILNRNEIKFYNIIESQSMAYIIGVVLFIVGYVVNKKFIQYSSIYIYILSILLSLSVFINNFGMNFAGSTRWINFMGVSFQPGELLKLSLIIMLSTYFSRNWRNFESSISRKNYLYFFLLIAVPVIIMYFQKDLGTLLIMFAIFSTILVTSNVKALYMVIFTSIIALSAIYYGLSNDYVKNRIFDFNSDIKNVQGISYQNKQALISIGNGEIFGRGIGQSVQKFYYLPEPAGDSIFAVYLEEYGFVGGVVVLLLFLYLIVRIFMLSFLNQELFSKYFLGGLATLIFAQTFLNMGSMLGVIPISGDTLPLFSHGGTALICNMFSLGFMLQLTKKFN